MKNYFKTIYKLALTKNEAGIKKLLAKGVAIDEFKTGSYCLSAAAMHASEGSRDIAERLRFYGAHFDWIALGAAIGGYFKYVDELRLRYDVSLEHIAFGAAQGAHFEYTEKLRAEKEYLVNAIAKGAAYGGHFAYAEQLHKKYKADICEIARYAAFGGYVVRAESYRRKYAKTLLRINKKGKHMSLVNCIARGAAQGGQIEYAEKLRKYASVMIACDAALGGYFDYAEQLRKQSNSSASIGQLILFAMKGGHTHYIEFLRILPNTDIKLIYVAIEAVDNFHIGYMEHLQTQHEIRSRFLLSHIRFYPLYDKRYTKRICYFLTQFQNDRFRNYIVGHYHDQIHKRPGAKYAIKLYDILNIANYIINIKRRYHQILDYDQALLLRHSKNFERFAIWFLLGTELMDVYKNLSLEVFIIISQYATGLSAIQTSEIFTLFRTLQKLAKRKGGLKKDIAKAPNENDFFAALSAGYKKMQKVEETNSPNQQSSFYAQMSSGYKKMEKSTTQNIKQNLS